MHEVALAVEIEAQVGEAEFGEGEFAGALQGHAHGGDGFRGLDGRLQAIGRFPFRAGDFERPEGEIVAGAELAGHAVDGARIEDAGALHFEAGIGRDGGGVDGEFGHGHGRHRAQIVGMQNAEHRLGDFGELVVDLEVDAGGEEGEGFEHTLDMRVFALIGLEHEAGGYLGILGGELDAHLAQEGEFALVVEQQVIPHWRLP